VLECYKGVKRTPSKCKGSIEVSSNAVEKVPQKITNARTVEVSLLWSASAFFFRHGHAQCFSMYFSLSTVGDNDDDDDDGGDSLC
jgi:hypothetical protein